MECGPERFREGWVGRKGGCRWGLWNPPVESPVFTQAPAFRISLNSGNSVELT